MAIIIPSKNIYKTQFPKSQDNVIGKVSIEAKNVTPKRGAGQVHGEANVAKNLQSKNYDRAYATIYAEIDDAHSVYRFFVGEYQLEGVKHFAKTITINRAQNNGYCETASDISCNILYEVETGDIVATLQQVAGNTSDLKGNEVGNYASNYVRLTNHTTVKRNSEALHQSPVIPSAKYSWENDLGTIVLRSAPDGFDKTDLSGLTNRYTDEKEIRFDITVLCGFTKTIFGGSNYYVIGDYVYGTYEKYIPQNIEITVNGVTETIEITDELISYGDKSPEFSVSGSELLQTSAVIGDLDTENGKTENLATNNAKFIADNYKDGRDSATLLCSVGEYYDEQGNLAISTKDGSKPMCFDIGDIVFPMVYTEEKQDAPMLDDIKKDGKVFSVIGVNYIYDGAVWQELTLQEAEREELK